MYINIVDGNSLGYGYFHSKKNIQNGAVIGFLEGVIKSLLFRPDAPYVVLWDDRAHWRYELHPAYKSGRSFTPEQRQARAEYEAQRPVIQQLLAHLPVIQLTPLNAEADDLAFQLTRQIQQLGYLSKLFTADTDWLYCVDKLVHWINAKRPAEEVSLYNFGKLTRFIKPEFVPMIKAIEGDKADDIYGVKGLGEVRATAIIEKYGSLANVLHAAGDILNWSNEANYYQILSNMDVQNNVLTNYNLINLANAPQISSEDIQAVWGVCDVLSLGMKLEDLSIQLPTITEDKWSKLSNQVLNNSGAQVIKKAIAQMNLPVTESLF